MEKILKTIFYEWKERKLPQIIRREKNLKEYLQTKPPKIIAITGFRRVGKTYLVFQLIKELLKKKNREEIVYINFEDERIPLRTEILTDLLPTVKQTFQKLSEILFLDEIQEIPGWSKWIRRIYDQERIKIFVTGSSSKMSSREIPTELRGRCLEIKIFPLSFKEFLKFKDIGIDFKRVPYSENEKAKVFKALEEYLFYGGMPEVVLAPVERKIEILQGYYKTVIRRDISQRFKVKNEEGLKALLLLILNSTSYSITKLYNTLKSLNYKIGKTTLLNYLSYIENSYFAESVPIFSYKVKNQLQYPRKIYFVDNGFITALSTKFSKDFGRLYENLVFQELKRRTGYQTEIFYWKDRTGREVDFVLRDRLKIKKLIQVCYDINDSTTRDREIKSLLRASKELKCDNLMIINQDIEKVEEMKDKEIKFIPLWKWLMEK
ncbi:ATP-binding protein [Patescibacteria group bacterium]|nr:ATP-binding protein [Patescibacteria group bacterium]